MNSEIHKFTPIEHVGLPTRAENALKRSNVHTLQAVLQLVDVGFDGVPGMGKKLKQESFEVIKSFLTEHDPHRAAGMPVGLPAMSVKGGAHREIILKSFGADLPAAFPSLLDEFICRECARSYDRDKTIIQKRFGLIDGNFYTLEDLGAYFDVTRERIRQIEAKIISRLAAILRGDIKPKKLWCISPELIESFKEVSGRLNGFNFLVLDTEVSRTFEEVCGNDLLGAYRPLLLELCGYRALPERFVGFRGRLKKSWCKNEKGHRADIENLYSVLDDLYDSSSSASLFDVVVKVKRKKRSFANESVGVALKACDDLEIVDDTVRAKFSALRNHADRAYRVLEEADEALHFGEIVRRINERLQGGQVKFANSRAVTGQLVSDERFIPIGKSGNWSLAQWGQKNLTIVEAIEAALHVSGKPLKFKEICAAVATTRPDAAARSIRTYLCNTPDKFSRVADGQYALSGWSIPAINKAEKSTKLSNEDFYLQCVNAFGQAESVPLVDLVKKLISTTGLADVSIRQRLNSVDWVRVEKHGSKRSVYLCAEDINQVSGEKRTLLRDKVQSEIVAILQSHPNVPFKKGKLYTEVLKNVSCIKPTFYSYLNSLDHESVVQYQEGSDYLVEYKHVELVEKIPIDLNSIQSIDDVELKGTLERAVNLLSHATVDLGLLELGRTLESILKGYLVKARRSGVLTVQQRDLRTFASMIECVSRENVVSRSYQLSILREERNARAHGESLNAEARQVLFNRAHFLADLFVKYIVLFFNKKREL